MPTDAAEVLRRLKAYIVTKPNHGQRDLLAELGRLEAVCGVDPSAYEQFLARFGDELSEAFLNIVPADAEDAAHEEHRPITDAAASATAMAVAPSPSIGPSRATKEDPCPAPKPKSLATSAVPALRRRKTRRPRIASVAT